MKKNKNNKNNKNKIIKVSITIIGIIILSTIILLLLNKPENKLSYEISYNGINCPTPYVIFYNDGTYKYYKYYGTEIGGLKPQKGKYEFDMNKLIKNVNNYEPDQAGPYTINVSDGKSYTTYSTNKELRELLDKNGIILEKCMTMEDE